MAARQDLAFEFRTRVGNSVAYDTDVARENFFGVSTVITRKHDAEIDLLHEVISQRACPGTLNHLEPLRQPSGVPMKNDPFEKAPAHQHYHPVSIEGRALSGTRNIIKISH